MSLKCSTYVGEIDRIQFSCTGKIEAHTDFFQKRKKNTSKHYRAALCEGLWNKCKQWAKLFFRVARKGLTAKMQLYCSTVPYYSYLTTFYKYFICYAILSNVSNRNRTPRVSSNEPKGSNFDKLCSAQYTLTHRVELRKLSSAQYTVYANFMFLSNFCVA